MKKRKNGRNVNKLNWEREKYKGKKFVKWDETSFENQPHELRIKEFFEYKKRMNKG